MRIVGVDPGKEGCAALRDLRTGTVSFFDMPLTPDREHDTLVLFQHLLEFEPDVLITERVIKPLVLVEHLGEIKACGKILSAEVIVAPVNSWKKRILGEVTSDKKKSIARALELDPTLELVKPRCRVPSHDRAESYLLTEYYILTNKVRTTP